MADATGDAKSLALANDVLNKELGAADYTPPVSHFLALYTSALSDSGGGTEATGGSYERVEITNDTTNWPTTTTGEKANGVAFAFPQLSASIGTATHWALHSHETNDTPRYWDAIRDEAGVATSLPLTSGSIPTFAIGALIIRET